METKETDMEAKREADRKGQPLIILQREFTFVPCLAGFFADIWNTDKTTEAVFLRNT